ncbi:hypothetical protein [Desulfobacula toluolica]|uniref:hypothetical protein n=1 Tax=Desulfobacula toluolica TaxID=28223 RepID=UPI00031CBB0A|nr:hypothetical protein [Desulfobacula toluolica]
MRFLTVFIFSLVSAFLFWALLIAVQVNNPTQMSQWIYDVYEKKQLISERIMGEKIILLAGSNILFGVDSQKIARAFHMPVLNYGVNAGIDLPYTLETAKKVVHPGDIILMPLEYPMYSYDGTPSAQTVDYIFSRDPGFFWKMSLKEQINMVLYMDLKRLLRGFLYQGGEKIDTGLYGAHQIDSHGDQINTNLKFKTWAMFKEIHSQQLKPKKYSETFDPDAIGWQFISEFILYCKKLNVSVIFMPSTLMKHESYYTNPGEKWFYDNIVMEVRRRGWRYVGNPYDYMYEPSLYFNTYFHLTETGRQLRTEQMIRDLKTHILIKHGF